MPTLPILPIFAGNTSAKIAQGKSKEKPKEKRYTLWFVTVPHPKPDWRAYFAHFAQHVAGSSGVAQLERGESSSATELGDYPGLLEQPTVVGDGADVDQQVGPGVEHKVAPRDPEVPGPAAGPVLDGGGMRGVHRMEQDQEHPVWNHPSVSQLLREPGMESPSGSGVAAAQSSAGEMGAHDGGGAEGRGGVHQEPASGGYVHCQAVLKFEHARSFSSVQALWKSLGVDTVHLERCKSWKAAVKYCCKPETRLDGPVFWGTDKLVAAEARAPKRRKLCDYFDPEKATEWQRKFLELVDGPISRRKVHWWFSIDGGIGKSTLVRHLVLFRFKGRALVLRGGLADVAFAVQQWIEEEKKPLDLVIIDIPRCSEGHVSYRVLEMLKDGLVFCTKYKSGQCGFAPPHVFVTANVRPDTSKLSKDRWDIYQCFANGTYIQEEVP